MQITLNGEPKEVAGGLTVSQLLEELQLDKRQVAVERNLEIVSRSAHESTFLSEGDRIEIVRFIGGG